MIEAQYQPAVVESEVQKFWEEYQPFSVAEDLNKEKFFCLAMFPYPSGTLHMGHVRNYTLPDAIARYQRMLGKNVLHPIGWDAFGLPAENAAISRGIPPAEWTYANINHMRQQLKRLGLAYDWKREVTTCDPNYYRWEQWLFLKLFEKGLAYQKKAVVNWDPVDNTVLANEQVVNGRGWRSGALVERREIKQWFLKITAYADELLQDLESLEGWPEQVKTMQRNWIGKSQGAEIQFKVENHADVLTIFTTCAHTLYGVTYLAIAPQHPLAQSLAEHNPALAQFIEECRNVPVAEAALATLEKKGMDTGLFVLHPLTHEKLPIWVANFVIMDYGSGAVMAVPAHDQRDFEFAQKYHLPIKPVVQPPSEVPWDLEKAAYTLPGTLINSEQFTGLSSEAGKIAIIEKLVKQKLGVAKIHYHLRDWGISRQRYWGAPIPMIHCEACSVVPVPEKDLPVILPEKIQFKGVTSPLKDMPEFYEVVCPRCGKMARRETDTFDTFMESSWYYARFACVDQANAMLDDRAKYWTPVDQYVGGIEHAVMHLLYARFLHKLMRDEGLLNGDEPFARLMTQGMVLKDGAKMSKSKGNTVDPQQMIDRYGADAVRLFVIFAAPPEASIEWSDSGLEGANRFLKRVWQFAHQYGDTLIKTGQQFYKNRNNSIVWAEANSNIRHSRREIYEITRQARFDMERLQLNTVVSGTMKLLNALDKLVGQPESDAQQAEYRAILISEGFSILLRLLSPIAPHITHYLWRQLGYEGLIINAKWPKVPNDAIKVDIQKLVVQVNGKVRSQIEVSSDATEAVISQTALNDEKIKSLVGDKKIKKMIIVPGRIVNVVV